MSERAPDPNLRVARREAVVVAVIWIAAMGYTLLYCYFNGYNRPPSQVKFILGIPDWVVYGVLAPWLVCWALSLWFTYAFMEDVPLGEDDGSTGMFEDDEEDWLHA